MTLLTLFSLSLNCLLLAEVLWLLDGRKRWREAFDWAAGELLSCQAREMKRGEGGL